MGVYKFKGFDSVQVGDSVVALEAMVNAWMEEVHPRIRHMAQSMRGEHIILSFVYEDMQELEKHIAMQTQADIGITGAFPRVFDDDFSEDRPTSPSIPATPPPYASRKDGEQDRFTL
jgi:hypothetical protein